MSGVSSLQVQMRPLRHPQRVEVRRTPSPNKQMVTILYPISGPGDCATRWSSEMSDIPDVWHPTSSPKLVLTDANRAGDPEVGAEGLSRFYSSIRKEHSPEEFSALAMLPVLVNILMAGTKHTPKAAYGSSMCLIRYRHLPPNPP